MTLRSVAVFAVVLGALPLGWVLAQEQEEAPSIKSQPLIESQPSSESQANRRPARRVLVARIQTLEERYSALEKQHSELEKQLAALKQKSMRFRSDETERQLPTASEIKIFTLENADAAGVADTLMTLFGGRRGDDPLRLAVDRRTNSVVAAGTTDQLQMIEAILMRLDEMKPAEKAVVPAS